MLKLTKGSKIWKIGETVAATTHSNMFERNPLINYFQMCFISMVCNHSLNVRRNSSHIFWFHSLTLYCGTRASIFCSLLKTNKVKLSCIHLGDMIIEGVLWDSMERENPPMNLKVQDNKLQNSEQEQFFILE